MKENDLFKNKVHSFSTKNNVIKQKQISSHKYINTISKIFKNLTPLEERMDMMQLSKAFLKSLTTNNSKSNSYNKKKSFDYNSPKKFINDYRAKFLYLKDKKTNSNKVSPNIMPYISKENLNRKINNSYKDLLIKPEVKAKLLESEKISKIKQEINIKEDKFQKFLERKKELQRKKNENEEIKKEKKNIKIKMYNIINKKGQICQTFLKKNDNFNLKFFNYLNSKYFIKCKKDFSEKIHFSKNDLNKAHDPFKQYLTTYSITKNSITLKDIFDSLNNRDKKIIEKEPNFFFRNNKVFEELSDIHKKPLYATLREEEDIENMIKNKKPKKEIEKYKEKNDIINQRILGYTSKNNLDKEINNNKDKYDDLPELIDQETMEKIKNDLNLRLKYKRKNVNKMINDDLKKFEWNIVKKNLKRVDNKNFNNTFNKTINFGTKIHILDNNNKRLSKEELFQKKRKIIDNTEEKSDKYLNNLKNKIMDIYHSNNKNKNENIE